MEIEKKFTPTELKVISCFARDITSYKSLEKVLNSSIKTIRKHVANIRNKTNASTNEEITVFLSKCSRKEIKYLEQLFNEQFIFNQFSIVAEKISEKLAILKPTCICSIFGDLTSSIDDIIKTIEILGFKIHKSQISKYHPKARKKIYNNDFNLCISEDPKELQEQNKENTILICLGEKQTKYRDIFFYNKDNIKELYHYIITFLLYRYSQVAQLNQEIDLLKSVDNYDNHPLSKEIIKLEKKEKLSHSPTLQSNTTYWKLGIFFIIISLAEWLFIIYAPKYSNPSEVTKTETLAYNLPPKNQQFTGREDIIKQLEANLDSSNVGVSIQVISGSGGVGKSQLLTEYAYRNKSSNKYNALLWLNSHNNSTIDNSYNAIAEKLGINTINKSPSYIKKTIHKTLKDEYAVKNLLMILDNVPSEKDIQPYLENLKSQWSFDTNVDVLISTRSKEWKSNTFVLDMFSPDEAKALIKRQLPYETDEDIDKLAKLLNYYPLALGQAVGFIEQHTTIPDYINL